MAHYRWNKGKSAGRKKTEQQVASSAAVPPGERPLGIINAKLAAIVDDMPAELRTVAERVLRKLAVMEANDLIARHEIAVEVSRVDSERGRGAVVKLAAAIGKKKQTLYAWASIGSAWPTREAFEAVLSRRTIYGRPLTWYQLIQIANVKEEEDREALLDLAVAKDLGVRQLQAHIAERQRATSRATLALPPTSASREVAAEKAIPPERALANKDSPPELESVLQPPAGTKRPEHETIPTELSIRGEAPYDPPPSPERRDTRGVRQLEAVLAAARVAHVQVMNALDPVVEGLRAAESSLDFQDVEGPDLVLVEILKEVHRIGSEVNEAGFVIQRLRKRFFRRVRPSHDDGPGVAPPDGPLPQ